VPFFRFLRDTKDSDLIVVFGENAAATVGLVVALFALLMSAITGDTHWDGVGSAGEFYGGAGREPGGAHQQQWGGAVADSGHSVQFYGR
jgi:hypothetical protein